MIKLGIKQSPYYIFLKFYLFSKFQEYLFQSQISYYRFFNDLKRTDEQTAFFAELTFPLTEKLDILVGARQYDLDIDYVGQSKFGGLAEGNSGRDYNSSGGHTDQPLNMKDTITKVTASYKMDEDTLIYFTQSEGYRPGGYNRGGGLTNSCAKKDPTADGYCGVGAGDNFRANPTTTFESDEVLNTELGIKTVLADGTMRVTPAYVIQQLILREGQLMKADKEMEANLLAAQALLTQHNLLPAPAPTTLNVEVNNEIATA